MMSISTLGEVTAVGWPDFFDFEESFFWNIIFVILRIFNERLFKFLWFCGNIFWKIIQISVISHFASNRRREVQPVWAASSPLANLNFGKYFSHEELSILVNILDQGWIKSRLSGRTLPDRQTDRHKILSIFSFDWQKFGWQTVNGTSGLTRASLSLSTSW